ncbi:inositol monophosphatase [Corynebacterium sp. CCM 8835]|uniref:Inositol-1-monophosphatase n=1 Tax=Corynebacterium antarcticum TaxID=2800405 RepID=A0ABS1FK04_9CORY|nr:inositol monophosphatase family protein [Corynebacterium antarcticum]MCK7641567.1 inositol monophosphatase [Corynebacterium antarcticum]MCK7660335.1 inositol monophosphatase [Corynebacterium antarcticum]MCL0244795.1 inositol monophosphatase [Corynebacterium antarcticum]MCX7491168.1 inositol monophosphatase family protein [Corynebacterium antarcticum]MCX7539649.1 inositol monophosphatase family protein [Corynebacterium antarcticum]
MTETNASADGQTQRSTDPEILRDLAVDWARQAHRLIVDELSRIDDLSASVTLKSSEVDPVTVVDRAVEELVTGLIAEERPGDGLIGEEGAHRVSSTSVDWVVDPIDGTVNFLYGVPMYAVSIAAAVDGTPVAGVILNAATGELYSAATGHGSFLTTGDGRTRRLRCNGISETNLALVATGFSYDSGLRGKQAEMLTRMLPRVRDIRRMGSAALDLCQLAAGRVDAYYEHALNGWDFAAGTVIAREAGARVEAPALGSRSADGELIWAAAGPLADDFGALLGRCGVTGTVRRAE